MRKADKAIERAKGILQKAVESIQAERDEAYGNWSVTGWQRYQTKMDACDEDIEKLNGYIHSWREIRTAEREAQKYKKVISIYLNKLDEFEKEYPGDDYVAQIVSRCKSKMESAKMEADRR